VFREIAVPLPLLAAGAVWLFGACSSGDADSNPAEVLTRFLEAMDRSAIHEAALNDAYALLDEAAQRELSARASRTSSLSGRVFAPWEMIAQGRFRLRFAPAEHTELRATVTGDTAVVHMKSDDARVQADVPLVREHGHWRVKLGLPELARAATPAQ
jgi:hypothetical protein